MRLETKQDFRDWMFSVLNPLKPLYSEGGEMCIRDRAKTITEAQKNEKIAALLTRREALERELKNTEQSHKRNKLISQIETTEEKIKKVRTGERFTRQEKRDLVAYSFIAPNFIGFAVFTLGPIIFAFVLAFMKWDGNSPMEFAGLKNFIQMAGNARFRSS